MSDLIPRPARPHATDVRHTLGLHATDPRERLLDLLTGPTTPAPKPRIQPIGRGALAAMVDALPGLDGLARMLTLHAVAVALYGRPHLLPDADPVPDADHAEDREAVTRLSPGDLAAVRADLTEMGTR